MKFATYSADSYYYLLLLTSIWVFHREVGAPLLLAAILSFAVEVPLQHVIKVLVRRNRPFERFKEIQFILPPPDRFSFPSGHTAGAFLLAILLSSFYPVLSLPLFVWAGGVGLSRIYLGVHYPSDVLAGVLLGILSATAGIALMGLV